MGLDLPLYQRVARVLRQVLRGDLGADVISGRPVRGMVLEALPNTHAARRLGDRPRGADRRAARLLCRRAARAACSTRSLAVLSVSFIAMPSFVVAILLLYFFSVWLGWLPVLGAGEPAISSTSCTIWCCRRGAGGRLDRLHRPAGALLAARGAGRALHPHGRAYGQPERRVVIKYALKNACIPTVAVLGLGIGGCSAARSSPRSSSPARASAR